MPSQAMYRSGSGGASTWREVKVSARGNTPCADRRPGEQVLAQVERDEARIDRARVDLLLVRIVELVALPELERVAEAGVIVGQEHRDRRRQGQRRGREASRRGWTPAAALAAPDERQGAKQDQGGGQVRDPRGDRKGEPEPEQEAPGDGATASGRPGQRQNRDAQYAPAAHTMATSKIMERCSITGSQLARAIVPSAAPHPPRAGRARRRAARLQKPRAERRQAHRRREEGVPPLGQLAPGDESRNEVGRKGPPPDPARNRGNIYSGYRLASPARQGKFRAGS